MGIRFPISRAAPRIARPLSLPPWYRALNSIPLANCLLAYQAKGAASLAASKVNLANPGTYDATAGVDPTFAAATGWQFTGTQWLSTNLAFSSSTYTSMTFAWQFSGWSGSNRIVSAKGGYTLMAPLWGGTTPFFQMPNGRQTYNTAAKSSGNIIVMQGSAEKVYYDGVDQSGTFFAGGATGSSTHQIGSDGSYFANGYIRAYAIYNIALSAAQAAALAAAMAAL